MVSVGELFLSPVLQSYQALHQRLFFHVENLYSMYTRHLLTRHTLSAASLYHWILVNPWDIHNLVVNPYMSLTCLIMPCCRTYTQVIFWKKIQLWSHCANVLPLAGVFLANYVSMRPLWMHQCGTFSCVLENFHQIQVLLMSYVVNKTVPYPSSVSSY